MYIRSALCSHLLTCSVALCSFVVNTTQIAPCSHLLPCSVALCSFVFQSKLPCVCTCFPAVLPCARLFEFIQLPFPFTDFGGSSFTPSEGAVFTSKGKFYFFSCFRVFYGGVACSVLPRTFPTETLPDFLLRFRGSPTIDLEGVLFFALCLGREC